MKSNHFILIFSVLLQSFVSSAQKNITEGTLVYNISVETGNAQPGMADMLDGATTTVCLNGTKSRTEMVSGLGREATIHNSFTGDGVILKDYSGQKLMITLTSKDWQRNNQKYDGITFENTGDTAGIAGFKCYKAIAKLKDGTSFVVYYTRDIRIANKDYDYQFRTLPGLAVQYEMQTGKMKFKFTLASINYADVSESLFEIPKAGYRVLTYGEAKKK
jgi:GLPGLI family protein